MFLIAHRAQAPSLVTAAVDAGATVVELDVRVRGGGVVVTHYGPVRWSRGLLERDNGRFRVRGTWPRDRSFEEVAAAVPDTARILLDPKDRDPQLRPLLAERLAKLVDDPSRCVVSTKNTQDLARYRDAGFRTWRTLDTRAEIAQTARRSFGWDGVTVRHTSLTADGVAALHTVTDTVVAWTVNDPARAEVLAGYGVDGVTTDRVGALAAVLAGGTDRRGA